MLEGWVKSLPRLRPGERRFCGLTLQAPLAEVQQHFHQEWLGWARLVQQRHKEWQEQQRQRQQEQEGSRAGKKGRGAKGKAKKLPEPAKVGQGPPPRPMIACTLAARREGAGSGVGRRHRLPARACTLHTPSRWGAALLAQVKPEDNIIVPRDSKQVGGGRCPAAAGGGWCWLVRHARCALHACQAPAAAASSGAGPGLLRGQR